METEFESREREVALASTNSSANTNTLPVRTPWPSQLPCFICGTLANDSANDELLEFATCLGKLFSFDLSDGMCININQVYCQSCQEYLRTIMVVHKQLEDLNKKLGEARLTIHQKLNRNFKANMLRANQEGVHEERQYQIQAQKHVLKKASLMFSRSAKFPSCKNADGRNGRASSLQLQPITVKVEPIWPNTKCFTGSDSDEFLKNAGRSDVDLHDLEFNQPAVRFARMVVLESLIKSSPDQKENNLATSSAHRKTNRPSSTTITVRSSKRYTLEAEDMGILDSDSYEPVSDYSNRNRKRTRQTYSEYADFSDDDFDNNSNLTEEDLEDDNDFILGLDDELYDDYDSDYVAHKSKSTTHKLRTHSTALKPKPLQSTSALKQSSGKMKSPPVLGFSGDGSSRKEICVLPNIRRCTVKNCPKEYTSEAGLRKHLRVVHKIPGTEPKKRPPPIEPTVRPEKDASGNVLYVRLFPCNVCGKEFKESYELKYHLERHKPDSERKHICDVCGKGFYKASLLKRHKRKHSAKDESKPEAYVMCEVCGKSTLNPWQHMRTHTDERDHKCKFCDKGFNTANAAKAHMRIHTGEKPFECKECGLRFRTDQGYRRHLKVHDPVKAYICDYCGKSFRFKSNLTEHVHIHTKQAPHRCNVCGRRFAERSLLDKHTSEFHTAEQIERKRKGQRIRQQRQQVSAENADAGQESQEQQHSSSTGAGAVSGLSLITSQQHSAVVPTRYY